MDIAKSLTFTFEDERWLPKLAVAGALLFALVLTSFTIVIPIAIGVLLTGYQLAIARNVRRGDPHPLPEWTGIGDMFTDGVKLGVALLVWAVPMLVAYVPVVIAAVIGGGSSGDPGPVLAQLAAACGGCLIALYGLFLGVVQPAIYAAYLEGESISSALDVGRVVEIARRHVGALILILVAMFFVSLVAGLGVLLCFVGLLLSIPWSMFVQGHLYGQLAAAAAGDMGAPAGPFAPFAPEGPPATPPREGMAVGPEEPIAPEDVVADALRMGEEALGPSVDLDADRPPAEPSEWAWPPGDADVSAEGDRPPEQEP